MVLRNVLTRRWGMPANVRNFGRLPHTSIRRVNCLDPVCASKWPSFCRPVWTAFSSKTSFLNGDSSAPSFNPPLCRYASKNVKKDKKGPKIIKVSDEELGTVVDFEEYETALKNLVEEFRDQLAKQFVLRTSSGRTFSAQNQNDF